MHKGIVSVRVSYHPSLGQQTPTFSVAREILSLKEGKMDKTIDHILSRENPVFAIYVFYSSILVIKMMLMSTLTAFRRSQTKVF